MVGAYEALPPGPYALWLVIRYAPMVISSAVQPVTSMSCPSKGPSVSSR